MTLQLLSVGQLVACVAYLCLAYAFFLLAEWLGSLNAKIAAIAFAYCGIGLLAQIAATLGQYISYSPGLRSITNSYVFGTLVGGLRPYALLLAAICAIRLARAGINADTGVSAHE